MAHIVCMTTGLTGILHASYEVVARLEAAGHRVTYACPWPVQDQVEAQGFAYRQLPRVVFEPGGPEAPLGFWTKWATLRKRQDRAVEALGMSTFKETLDELSPDLLLMDMELHDHIITAVAGGWPVVLLSQWFSTWKRPGLPPVTSTLIPDPNRTGNRLRVERVWLRRRVKEWRKMLNEGVGSGFTDRRSVLKRYARKAGFPRRLLQQFHWPPPFTYGGLTVLSMTASELEFPHPARPGMHYVGPMVYGGRRDITAESDDTGRLKQVLDEARESGRSIILCTMTTMDEGDSVGAPREPQGLDLLKRTIAAVGDRPDWTMIVGLGKRVDPSYLGPLPTNVHTFAWVPQLDVLAHANCSISHGGIHTINECLHFGVPMVIYSGRKYDQNGCAARVVRSGVGVRGDSRNDDPKAIVSRIAEVLEDPAFKTRVDQVSRLNGSEEARRRLVDVVESSLAGLKGRAG